ncbi:unnamed protein product [Ambrosiozyma monospora]|uniref:Unnamed protein product n=1 Tax=Ambrosiozyma monospora TaxID=43982 RepID=A0A9W7DFW7_AMBMO|nr:unnamed protein product [Ambrosiozyma monospora]
MVGASEEDESKLRFYASKIIRNLMFKAISGQLDSNPTAAAVSADPDVDADRKSLIDILNFDSPFDYLDDTGEQFEITIDVDRL